MKLLLDSLKMAGENFQSSFSIADVNEPDKSLVYVNKQFEIETGYSYDEAVKNNCRFLQGPATDQFVTQEIKNKISNTEFCYADIINYKKDGSQFLNRLLLIPIYVNKIDVRYYIGIQLDVSNKSNSFKQAIYDLGPKAQIIMDDLQDIINYYRSLEYLDLADNQSQKLKDLGLSIKNKINKICNCIQKI